MAPSGTSAHAEDILRGLPTKRYCEDILPQRGSSFGTWIKQDQIKQNQQDLIVFSSFTVVSACFSHLFDLATGNSFLELNTVLGASIPEPATFLR